MATPADQRLLELLDTWLKSLELHARYSSLDDDSYWKIQPWVEHQRPSRWIVELAMQKTIALRRHLEERVKMGDATYGDSLELMIFLANLVGSEHIERFIPAAEPQNERSLRPPHGGPSDGEPPVSSQDTAPGASDTVKRPAAESSAVTATREMPKFLTAKRAPPAAGTAQVARAERKTAAPVKAAAKPPPKPAARPAPKSAGKPAAKAASAAQPDRSGPSDPAREQVVADAARLVQWGRKWYELPELIARMAGRPTLPEVRRILKENKAAIDAKAGGA
jgi:hypothetical protein